VARRKGKVVMEGGRCGGGGAGPAWHKVGVKRNATQEGNNVQKANEWNRWDHRCGW